LCDQKEERGNEICQGDIGWWLRDLGALGLRRRVTRGRRRAKTGEGADDACRTRVSQDQAAGRRLKKGDRRVTWALGASSGLRRSPRL
jgi:hypothetical protein